EGKWLHETAARASRFDPYKALARTHTRHRTRDDRVNHADERCVQSDPDCERRDGECAEPRRANQLAQTKADVGAQVLKHASMRTMGGGTPGRTRTKEDACPVPDIVNPLSFNALRRHRDSLSTRSMAGCGKFVPRTDAGPRNGAAPRSSPSIQS